MIAAAWVASDGDGGGDAAGAPLPSCAPVAKAFATQDLYAQRYGDRLDHLGVVEGAWEETTETLVVVEVLPCDCLYASFHRVGAWSRDDGALHVGATVDATCDDVGSRGYLALAVAGEVAGAVTTTVVHPGGAVLGGEL